MVSKLTWEKRMHTKPSQRNKNHLQGLHKRLYWILFVRNSRGGKISRQVVERLAIVWDE